MVLGNKEKMLAEAIANMLDDAALGDKTHSSRNKDERANTFTFSHEEIEQEYQLETLNLDHHEDIASAFSKIHSHKYIDDPSFALSMKKELTARGVPSKDQQKAMQAIEKIKNKVIDDSNEKDEGWNPDLDEVIKVSQPPQIEESIDINDNYDNQRKFFKNKKVREWINNNKTDIHEQIRRRIIPNLNELGYKCDDIKSFWEAYDDDAAEFVIRNRMHELYEELAAEWETINS